MLQKQYSCTSKFWCALLHPGFLLELFVSVSLTLFVLHLLRLFIWHFVLKFANSCESFKLYQPSNLDICYCWIYSVTPLDCSRLRDSRVPKIEKARTRKWEETGERKGGVPSPPSFPFFPVLRSYFRVSFSYAPFLLSERLETESGVILCIVLFNETWIAQTSC